MKNMKRISFFFFFAVNVTERIASVQKHYEDIVHDVSHLLAANLLPFSMSFGLSDLEISWLACKIATFTRCVYVFLKFKRCCLTQKARQSTRSKLVGQF